jgi:hypothetical protein
MNKSKFLTAMVLFAALSGNVLADLIDGLVAYYPFNGNARDESGNFNDGAVNGATLTEDRFGNKKSAYSFDGITNKIAVQDTPLLNFGKTELSIAVWIKTTQTGIWKRIVTKRANINTENWYSLALWNGKARFEIYAQGQLNSINDINDGNWHFLVITRNSSNKIFSMYIDGNIESTMTDEGRNLNSGMDTPLEIGIWAKESYAGTFNGYIDDIRIYNRALSESEIKQLYQGCQPSIEILLNSNNRVTGDKVVINTHIKGSANLDSSCKPSKVTAKVWAKLPNNSIIPLIKPLTGLNLLPSSDINTKIFEYIFRGAEPIGN